MVHLTLCNAMAHTATVLTRRELKCPEQRLVRQWEDLSAHIQVSGINITGVQLFEVFLFNSLRSLCKTVFMFCLSRWYCDFLST